MNGAMSRWQRFVFHKSRDPGWLWGAAVAILLCGVIGGAAAERLRAPEAPPESAADQLPTLPFGLSLDPSRAGPAGAELAEAVLLAVLGERPVRTPEVFDAVATWAPGVSEGSRPVVRGAVGEAVLDPATRELVSVTLDAVWIEEEAIPPELRERAERSPPVRHSNYAIGAVLASLGDVEGALVAFDREAADPAALEARERVVDLARERRDVDWLRRVADDPRYADTVDAGVRLDAAIAARDWWRVLLLIVPAQHANARLSLVLLACLAALGWFVLLAQMSQAPLAGWGRVALCVAGVALGAVSTTPTLFTVIWQEEVLGLVPRDDVAGGLFFFIAGVGLREEAIKLLFFAPLVPVLLRRGSQLEMLIVAGCVGLGFAAEENVSYYQYGATNAPGRYVTANFFHIAATALCGLALCRAFLHRAQGPGLFLQTFVIVVVIHGVYDAVLSIPALAEVSLVYLGCLAALAFWFFREVRALRLVRRDTLSLSGTFVLGIATLLSATLIVLAGDLGLSFALLVMIPTGLEMALLVYLFLREMPGTLVSV